MKLSGYGKEIVISLSHQFGEGILVSVIRQFKEEIVSAVRRQLNQRYFMPKREILQEPLVQIRWYYILPTIEELRKKESALPGKIVWRNV